MSRDNYIDAIKYLIEKGNININEVFTFNDKQYTTLQFLKMFTKDNPETIKLLVEHGAT